MNENFVKEHKAMGHLVVHGKITFTVDSGHPDWDGMTDKQKHGINVFDDTYAFSEESIYGNEFNDGIKEYVSEELSLCAGGGYNADHIHNVEIEVTKL